MIDGISSNTQIGSAQNVQVQASMGVNVELAVLKKSMDVQSNAMTQLLKGMGIGNNINALA